MKPVSICQSLGGDSRIMKPRLTAIKLDHYQDLWEVDTWIMLHQSWLKTWTFRQANAIKMVTKKGPSIHLFNFWSEAGAYRLATTVQDWLITLSKDVLNSCLARYWSNHFTLIPGFLHHSYISFHNLLMFWVWMFYPWCLQSWLSDWSCSACNQKPSRLERPV